MTHEYERRRKESSGFSTPLLIALLATGFALGGVLAHAYELPNKIELERDACFTVQGIYRGWNLLAIVLLVQLISMIAVAWRYRRRVRLRNLALLALGGLVAAQAVFWIWTFPANQATNNWTEVTENWETLRRNWEYWHLAGVAFQLASFVSLLVPALLRGRPQ
jgi:hypothetical protein